ncbi:HNH endonuclease [Gordonia alkanivorans]|uniref:HNH endonuclease domain-containing protein n=1 Tax=Gordonia alkanivorans TaxID=84096 RepID=UPI000FDE974D|nr:HNH endonuclease domain-containing protein [Gordonia alkanivorans]AZZ80231.1 HNH endonuclease [Gordonia alkanivorans]
MPHPTDPLALGQQLVAIIEGGRRTATYKLAVLMALLDLAVESVPDNPDAAVDVDLDDLTSRVIELYWRQMRPLDGHLLRQSADGRGVIFDAVSDLRAKATTHRTQGLDLVVAYESERYRATHAVVKRTLVRYPLKLLQNLTSGGEQERFLYDDSWMGTDSQGRVADHGNKLTLFPGVCVTLARLAPLLKPAFQLAWVDDVLPWSRVGIDGLANLVVSCQGCNSSKSDRLPAPAHVKRALDRGEDTLDGLAAEINWPSQYDRVLAAGHGLYSTQPTGTPIWQGRNDITSLGRVDINWLG